MFRITWCQARRTALVLAFVAFFATITVIGLFTDPDPLLEPRSQQLEARF